MTLTAPLTTEQPARLLVGGIEAQVIIEVTGHRAQEALESLRSQWRRCIPKSPTLPQTGSARLAEHQTITINLDGLTKEEISLLWTRAAEEVTRSLIQAQAGRLLMFWASAVSYPAIGCSRVFVSPGRAERTALTKALGREFGYISDELVALDPELRYPKPHSVHTEVGARHEVPPDVLGLLEAHPHPIYQQARPQGERYFVLLPSAQRSGPVRW